MDGGLSQAVGAYLKQYAREIISGGMRICAVISLCAIVPVVYMLTGSLFVRLLFLVFGGACVVWLIRRLYIYYHRRLHGRPPDKSMFRRVALYALLSVGGILLTFGFFGLIVSLLPLSVSQYQLVVVYGSYILSVWFVAGVSVLLSTLLWVVTWESSLQAYQRRGNRAQA
ncbi:MAG: hypothetical protein LBS18_07720 [Clostridiales bacterium]|jgi:hypothetical protein|nr:hypothetical protein [Clostridiales bacterium]